ncbi:MAG: ribosome maturation factor RimM [Bacilli bacterium]
MDYIEVGKIVGTHGIKGELKVLSDSDFKSERFKKGNVLYLKINDEYKEVKVSSYRPHKNLDLITINNLFDINEVLKYVNKDLYVKKDQLEKLNIDEYYYTELIGLEVVSLENELIGVVKDIMRLPQGEVLVVYNSNNKRILIPFVDEFIVEVKNKVIVKVIEGLI